MSVIWYKVWFDLWHNKIRTLLAVLSIAVGVFAIGATFGMADQISPTMDAAHEASVPAQITLITDGLDLETATRLKKIRGVAEIDLANAISVRYKTKPEDDWASGELFIRDYEEQSLGLYQIDTAEDNDIRLGEVITLDFGELGDSEWQVVGFFKNLDADSFGTDPLYANQEAVFSATKKYNRGNQLYVQTQDHRKPYVEAVLSQLEDIYNTKNMDTDRSETLYKVKADVKSEFDTVILMLLALAVIMALVGGIGLMGSLSISVVERTREIGVMRAIGARTPTMLGIFMLEGILQGLLSWTTAVPLSFIVGQPMAGALGEALFKGGLFYQYNFQAILIWLGIIMVISALASILPARNAVSISVRESLAYA